jgi:hypothetical protein
MADAKEVKDDKQTVVDDDEPDDWFELLQPRTFYD